MGIAPSELAPQVTGVTPESSSVTLFEISPHLTRREVKKTQEKSGIFLHDLWNERGEAVEKKVQNIIASQSEIVEGVEMNPPGTELHDLTVNLRDGKVVFVSVKSSSIELKHEKQKIRERIFTEERSGQLLGPWTKDIFRSEWNKQENADKEKAISSWLTDHNVILINGGEAHLKEKTKQEILDDSFYPQLKRILAKRFIDSVAKVKQNKAINRDI